jgi:exosortase
MNDEGAPVSARFALPGVTLLFVTLWAWAIWACAEHWQGNPNYSYGWAVPVLALFFALRRYVATQRATGTGVEPESGGSLGATSAAIALGILVFALEYAREVMWHPQIVLCSICLLAVALTLLIIRRRGGRELARAEMFPVLFFLTAVPWPPRFEQPITNTLMQWVAAATTELLHWIGVEAQTAGGAIALRSGLVGITEACSGIRSLQAGIMFGLAMGEWFLLRPGRRIILLVAAVALALITNLGRTMALALQAEWHGAESIDRVHDLVGNITITSLILGIWVLGKLFASRSQSVWPAESFARLKLAGRSLLRPATAVFAIATTATLLGIFGAQFVYARGEAAIRQQTQPRFVAKLEPAGPNRLEVVPREVWNELRPTSGEYVRHQSPELPGGGADCFHFFWKPSVWNRFALVHRPDICMPGIGWELNGPAEPIDAGIDGHIVRLYLFKFRRGNTHALELWGAWRNGELVPLDYSADQVFGVNPPPASLRLEGKRGSATEIVACSVIAEGAPPLREKAVALLQAVFHYKKDE